MVIRDLTKYDLDPFYACFEKLMYEGYGQFPSLLSDHLLNNDYKKENFILIMERNTRKIFILENEVDKSINGFLIGDHGYGGIAFISWFGVVIEERNKGYGTKLLEQYEQYAKSRNVHLMELFTYENVKGFYEKKGYVEVGRRSRGYYGMKNIIMDKVLADFDLERLIGPVKNL